MISAYQKKTKNKKKFNRNKRQIKDATKRRCEKMEKFQEKKILNKTAKLHNFHQNPSNWLFNGQNRVMRGSNFLNFYEYFIDEVTPENRRKEIK